jgi:hypothetical protein
MKRFGDSKNASSGRFYAVDRREKKYAIFERTKTFELKCASVYFLNTAMNKSAFDILKVKN